MIRTALSRFRVLGLRDLRAHWVRSLVSSAVVAVAAALLVAVLGTYGSLTGSVERLAVTIAGNADIEIVGVTDSGFAATELDTVRGVPGVDAAVPLLRSDVVTDLGRLTVLGVDASITALDSDLQGAISGSVTDLAQPDTVLAGPATGLTEGAELDAGNRTVTVAGVVTGPGAERIGGGNFIVAPLPLAQAITDRAGQLDSIFVLGDAKDAVTAQQPNGDF